MSNAIEDAIATALQTAGLGTVGTDLFKGAEKPAEAVIPARAIFLFVSDGFLPVHYMGKGQSFRQVFVEIFVRDRKDDQASCKTRAEQIHDKLDREYFDTFPGFVRCDALRSFPTYYGRNKDKQHIYHTRMKFGYIHTKVT